MIAYFRSQLGIKTNNLIERDPGFILQREGKSLSYITILYTRGFQTVICRPRGSAKDLAEA